jgi:SAM-dependent methyltransferase
MRRERRAPRPTQWDGLHLATVRTGIVAALDRLPGPRRRVLDLWCGTKPYDDLVPGAVGLDIDRHFGAADVVGATPFPFRAGAFDLALCSQALHILPDPGATVDELARAVAAGGHVVVTVPGLMLRVGPSSFEGRSSPASLATAFAGWDDVAVHGAGGPGAALAHGLNLFLDAARRRARLPRPLLAPLHALVNLVGAAVDRVAGRVTSRHHILVLTARRPAAGP